MLGWSRLVTALNALGSGKAGMLGAVLPDSLGRWVVDGEGSVVSKRAAVRSTTLVIGEVERGHFVCEDDQIRGWK